jgi:hypothetical protein
MSTFFFATLSGVLALLLVMLWKRWRMSMRADFIRSYMFPKRLLEKFSLSHPELTLKQRQLVARALRQFFLAHLKSGRKFVSMPSQIADELWHEFILYTRNYEAFCQHAFGQFMHHTPAVVLASDRQNNTGLRRTWWYCCLEENINPKAASRLPLIFSLDEKFNVNNGFHYTLDCKSRKRENSRDQNGIIYCGGDMSSSHFDGTTDGLGDSSTSFGDVTSGDSSGDSGGCGGGCGGGGD